MATIRQIEANRLNAQRSTGPRTDAGKAVSCLNNLKHGLRASTVVLPEENQEAFDAELERLVTRYLPEGIDEEHLVEQMVVSWWQAARVGRLINGSFGELRGEIAAGKSWRQPQPGETPLQNLMRQAADSKDVRAALATFSQMEDRFNRAYARAERRLAALQKDRATQPQPQPEPAAPTNQPERKPPASSTTPEAPQAPSSPLCPSYPFPEHPLTGNGS